MPMVSYTWYKLYHMLFLEDCHLFLFEVSFALMTPLASMTALAALLMCLKRSGPKWVPPYHLKIVSLQLQIFS